MNTEVYIEPYLKEFQKYNAQRANSPYWLKQKREQAFNQFKMLGFPTLKNEAWKYTNITSLLKQHFTLTTEKKSSISLASYLPYLFNESLLRMVFVDGYYSEELSNISSKECVATFQLGSLAYYLDNHPDLTQPYLESNIHENNHAFSKLNTAFMRDGAFIYISKKTVLSEPIYLLFITTSEHENKMSHIRNLIVAEPGSEAQIIEHYLCLDPIKYFNNVITEVYLQDNATLTHTKLQQEGMGGFHISTSQIQQNRSSNFTSHVFGLGANLARMDTNVVLAGEGAMCALNGFYYAKQRQHLDFHTTIEHVKPYGTSRENYKGIATDYGRAVFNGKVVVRPQAQKTDAMQNNKNILLSKHAEIDAKPELEIYADDVKCAHGAAIGQIDEDELFYLRSRGIDQQNAIHLILFAFAYEIIDKIKTKEMRAKILELVIQQLGSGDDYFLPITHLEDQFIKEHCDGN